MNTPKENVKKTEMSKNIISRRILSGLTVILSLFFVACGSAVNEADSETENGFSEADDGVETSEINEPQDAENVELATPGESNGEIVFIEDVIEPWCGTDTTISAGKEETDDRYVMYYLSFKYNGYEVCVYTTAEDNGEDAGCIKLRGANSGKTMAIVPVTVLDSNELTGFNKKWNTDETSGHYTFIKTIDNLKSIMDIISSSDNYDDADTCPLDGSLIYHTHPQAKESEDIGMSPEDFDPYSSYFNLEQYFKSYDVPGSYSYSAFDDGYESFGASEGQIYRCYYTFSGYELAIAYTDQEDLWSYDSGKITIYDDETGSIIASFVATGDKEKVVIDEYGNTCYRGTLVTLTQIMPVLVENRYAGYCPLDGLGLEHNH